MVFFRTLNALEENTIKNSISSIREKNRSGKSLVFVKGALWIQSTRIFEEFSECMDKGELLVLSWLGSP